MTAPTIQTNPGTATLPGTISTVTTRPPAKNIVELRNITQRYGNKLVIDNLSLAIENKPDVGTVVALLGLSGCGKSTLLRYIAGLQQPTSGDVFLMDQPRKENDVVGMVFQQYSSFPWLTVLDNVKLGLKYQNVGAEEAQQRAMEAIRAVGLDGHESKHAYYPKLSGGQLQRVAIARSLVCNPHILLMDEPFGALDTNTRLKMQLRLADLQDRLNSTVIFVTHDLQEAVFLANDIIIMAPDPGRIVARFQVDLPYPRTRDTKRTKNYLDMVNALEDHMTSLEPAKK